MTGIESLGPDLLAWGTEVAHDATQRGMYQFQDGFNPLAPVRSGLWRESMKPWGGAPSTDIPPRAPSVPSLGHGDIDQALQGWKFGGQAGFIERQPYTAFLLGGGSPKAPDLEADLDTLCHEIVAAQ